VSHTSPDTVPGMPVAAGRKGFKAELDGLRERMRGLGFNCDEIAAEVGRRYRGRPREAYRLAWGGRWSRRRRGSTTAPPGQTRTRRPAPA
jgi:hypothetical protein